MWGPAPATDKDEPLCLDCANDRPCAARRLAGVVREESAVRAGLDVYGELVFAGDNSSARVLEGAELDQVKAEIGAAAVRPPSDDAAAFRERLAKAATGWAERRVPLRRIRGVEVRLPARAVIGAEIIDHFAREAQEEGEREMPKGVYERDVDPVRAKVLAQPGRPARELAAELGIEVRKVYVWRHEEQKRAKAGKAERCPVRTAKPKPAAIQPIEVDTRRPGTASALLDALSNLDAKNGAAKFHLELNAAQVARLLNGFSAEQQAAFIQGGLQAALLA